MMDFISIKKAAINARINCIRMAHAAKESHLSSALSCVDILSVLYGRILEHTRPEDPEYPIRDRFFMSKGHGVTALYAIWAELGYLEKEELHTYGRTDSRLQDHPCKHVLSLLESSAGSLGHCLGIAAGEMLACRIKKNPARAFVLLGDGETNEGSVWEAAMFAAAQNLNRLVAIVDHNNTQAVGRNDELTGYASLEDKFSAFGWDVIVCQGNDVESLSNAFQSLSYQKPTAVIAGTTSGAGVGFMENDQVWFYRTPRDNEVEDAVRELTARKDELK